MVIHVEVWSDAEDEVEEEEVEEEVEEEIIEEEIEEEIVVDDQEEEIIEEIVADEEEEIIEEVVDDDDESADAAAAAVVVINDTTNDDDEHQEEIMEEDVANNNDDEDSKKIEFEKPNWTKDDGLKKTNKGQNLKSGEETNLASEITNINLNKEINNDDDQQGDNKLAWKKPEWAKKKVLKTTSTGEEVKKGANLAIEVTHIHDVVGENNGNNNNDDDQQGENKLAWKKPEWAKKKVLKTTSTGEAVKKGANLAIEVTHINDLVGKTDNNNNDDDQQGENKLAWKKPEWAKKKVLKSTAKGETVKQGVNLEIGITNISDTKDEKNIGWEKPSWAKGTKLKSTKTGDKLKKDWNLEKPITSATSRY